MKNTLKIYLIPGYISDTFPRSDSMSLNRLFMRERFATGTNAVGSGEGEEESEEETAVKPQTEMRNAICILRTGLV